MNNICSGRESVYTSWSCTRFPRGRGRDHASSYYSLISVVRRASPCSAVQVHPPFFGRTIPSPPAPLSVNRPLLRRRTVPSASAAGAVLQDAGATAGVLIGAYGLVYTFNKLTDLGIIEQSLSRKLVHISSGLLFMASWQIFSTSAGARYFAALVPLVNCLRLLYYGSSLARDEGLVKSVTRDGNPAELLRGPLYYVLILILCTLVFWRESPVGMIALAMMCGGDGIADIIGRRFGAQKLFYNHHKSWAGSVSMFLFGFLTSIGWVYNGFTVASSFKPLIQFLCAALTSVSSTSDGLLLFSSGILSSGLDIGVAKNRYSLFGGHGGRVASSFQRSRR